MAEDAVEEPVDEEPARVSKRPVAEAFDLILSEYGGYDDQKILDLNMDRFRQMVDVIVERRMRELKNDRRFTLQAGEMVVKGVGSALPGLAKTRKAASGIAKVIQDLNFSKALDSKEEQEKAKEDRVPSTARVMQMFGIRGKDGLAGVK